MVLGSEKKIKQQLLSDNNQFLEEWFEIMPVFRVAYAIHLPTEWLARSRETAGLVYGCLRTFKKRCSVLNYA